MPVTKKRKPKSKKKSNSTALVVVCIFVILAALAGLWYVLDREPEAPQKETASVKLYFVNTATNMWETETRQIPADAKRTDIISEVLNMLVAGPRSATLSKSIPVTNAPLVVSATLVEDTKTSEDGLSRAFNTVQVNLSAEYKELTGTAPAMCVNAIVYSLTELDFVDDVHFYIGDEELLKQNGQPVGQLNRDNVLLGNAAIPPETVDVRDITVYFADEDILMLVPERRAVEMSVSKSPEQYIVEELLKGPTDEASVKTIPTDTKLRSATTEGDICYVDLSAEFVNRFDGGSAVERLMVYSIVNALTELPNVKKVKFLVDGDNIVDAKSFSLDLSKPFERDADMLGD